MKDTPGSLPVPHPGEPAGTTLRVDGRHIHHPG